MNRPVALTLATATAASLLCLSSSAQAQDCTPPRVLFVLDASYSMNDPIEGNVTKWQAAREAVLAVLSAYPAEAEYGLMPFPGPGAHCTPGTVQVDVAANTTSAITTWMGNNTPAAGAYTPAGQTLMAASDYAGITDPDPNVHNYVIFVSDGWQWCSYGADPGPFTCAATQDCTMMGVSPCPTCNTSPDGCYCIRSWPELGAQALADAGVTTYVVGFGAVVDALTLNGAAEIGGTAPPGCNVNSSDPLALDNCYFQASQPQDLTDALAAIVQQVVTETCDGPCGIPGSRTCGLDGWSECDAPSTEDCMSSCNTPGTRECINGEPTECSSEAACGSGGSGGTGATGATGGTGATGTTGGTAGSGNTGNTGLSGASNPGVLDDPNEEGNCGCRVVGAGGRTGSTAALLGLFGLAGLGLRRRRS